MGHYSFFVTFVLTLSSKAGENFVGVCVDGVNATSIDFSTRIQSGASHLGGK